MLTNWGVVWVPEECRVGSKLGTVNCCGICLLQGVGECFLHLVQMDTEIGMRMRGMGCAPREGWTRDDSLASLQWLRVDTQ